MEVLVPRQHTAQCNMQWPCNDTSSLLHFAVATCCVPSPQEFLTLDDSLVNAIQRAARCKGADASMVQAAGILKRLQRRDTMYQPAGEAELPAHAEVGAVTDLLFFPDAAYSITRLGFTCLS